MQTWKSPIWGLISSYSRFGYFKLVINDNSTVNYFSLPGYFLNPTRFDSVKRLKVKFCCDTKWMKQLTKHNKNFLCQQMIIIKRRLLRLNGFNVEKRKYTIGQVNSGTKLRFSKSLFREVQYYHSGHVLRAIASIANKCLQEVFILIIKRLLMSLRGKNETEHFVWWA